ncbi:MAG: hypothetical protein ACOC3T_03110, partial [Bacteroidota bacterium]
ENVHPDIFFTRCPLQCMGCPIPPCDLLIVTHDCYFLKMFVIASQFLALPRRIRDFHPVE